MIGHVAPVRWAKLAAGEVSAPAAARMRAHAARCVRCRQAQERIAAAQAAMRELREGTGPELPWDSIRAKVRWQLGSGEGEAEAKPRGARRWLGAAAAVATVGAVVAAVALWPGSERAAAPPVAVAPSGAVPAVAPPVAVAPSPLSALVTRVRGVAQLDGTRDGAALFSRVVGAGTVVATAAGTLDLQLGEGTALTLGPRSTLRLERFDTEAIELSIDGVIDLEVAPRRPGQRFLVRAGAQTVEVRGTRFRVEHHADHTRVACHHGLVSVHDGAAEVAVAAGAVASLRTGEPPLSSALSSSEALMLALAAPYRLPWDDADALAAGSARLELEVAPSRRVRVDGQELGAGAVAVRVLRGRHLVETAAAGEPFQRAGWAEVGAGVASARFSEEEGASSAVGGATARARMARLAELRRALDRRQLARCVRSITKQGLADTFVTVELSVERDGAIGYLNIVDTDLPGEVAECVRSELAKLRFGAGQAARLRERLEL